MKKNKTCIIIQTKPYYSTCATKRVFAVASGTEELFKIVKSSLTTDTLFSRGSVFVFLECALSAVKATCNGSTLGSIWTIKKGRFTNFTHQDRCISPKESYSACENGSEALDELWWWCQCPQELSQLGLEDCTILTKNLSYKQGDTYSTRHGKEKVGRGWEGMKKVLSVALWKM